jgi:uncharacterized protein
MPRVAVTQEAAELLGRLRARHGPLMFHQSGGCCDGSAPMRYPAGATGGLGDRSPDISGRTGQSDVHLGDVHVGAETVPVWMSAAQYAYWRHTHLTIDVVKGRGSGFSLEAPEGVRFLVRSRLLTDAEWADESRG